MSPILKCLKGLFRTRHIHIYLSLILYHYGGGVPFSFFCVCVGGDGGGGWGGGGRATHFGGNARGKRATTEEVHQMLAPACCAQRCASTGLQFADFKMHFGMFSDAFSTDIQTENSKTCFPLAD